MSNLATPLCAAVVPSNEQPHRWPVRAPIGEYVYYFSTNKNCARERFLRILPRGRNNPHSHYNFPSGYKPAVASYFQVPVYSNLLCSTPLYSTTTATTPLHSTTTSTTSLLQPSTSWVVYCVSSSSRVAYCVSSTSRMAYIQRDRRGGIAASMRKRLRECGTER